MSSFRLFSSLVSNISLRTSTFRQNAKDVDTGRPSGHVGRGLGAIGALWGARQALKVFCSAGVDESISRVFCVRPLFIFMRTYDLLILFFARSTAQEARQQMTTAACREHASPQLTTKLQPCRPEAAATGSIMCVWQVRAVLYLVTFIRACDRSPDHPTTSTAASCCA